MHNILAPTLIVMGILLLVASGRLAKALENEVAENKAVKANQGLYTMGIMFLTAGLTMVACGMHGGAGDVGANTMVMLSFLLLLGIVLIGLSATIINADIDGTKGWASFILVLGILLVLGCSGMIYKHMSGKLAEVAPMKFGFGSCGADKMKFACY
jgi:Na+-driven multidrug efflux pump